MDMLTVSATLLYLFLSLSAAQTMQHGVVVSDDPLDLIKRVAQPDEETLESTCTDLINKIRTANKAPNLLWAPAMANDAAQDANNCSFRYDYFGQYGQTFFSLGYQNNSSPQNVNFTEFTYLAFTEWASESAFYNITSDEYSNLTYFQNSWDFTQLVWQASKTFGCGWSDVYCPNPVPGEEPATALQFLCYFDPPGNRWDMFGGNVTCPTCNAQPQTNTVTIPPIPTSTGKTRRAARDVADPFELDDEGLEPAGIPTAQAYTTGV